MSCCGHDKKTMSPYLHLIDFARMRSLKLDEVFLEVVLVNEHWVNIDVLWQNTKYYLSKRLVSNQS